MSGEDAPEAKTLALDLNRNSPVPLYHQIATQIESLISTRVLKAGDRIENETDLCTRLNLSRMTVRQALQVLVDKGELIRRRGIGTYVVGERTSRKVQLTSLYDDLASAGQKPETQVLLHLTEVATEYIGSSLGLESGAEVFHIRRLRSGNGQQVAILENFLPLEFASITPEQLVEEGLYQILRRRGITMRIARQSIGARSATPEESTLLGVKTAAPVLTTERLVFDDTGRAIEFGQHVYRADAYVFETTWIEQ